MRFSIIVPIYKVEKYIKRCTLSLINQSFSDFEIIFIDDASPDKSLEILKNTLNSIPDFKNYKILRHSINKGLPAARNTGLAIAKGEYIVHCDSDDFVETDMLAQYDTAIKKYNADIVWCDFYLSEQNSERIIIQPDYLSSREAVLGILGGQMKYNVWNKAINHNLYLNNNITFPEGHSMGEDMTIIKLFLHADKIAHISLPLYHYFRVNSNSISISYSNKNINDILYNVNLITDYINHFNDQELSNYLNYFKLSTKLPFLVNCNKNGYLLWHNIYSESNKYIRENPYFSLHAKILQFLAYKNLYPLLKIYNFIVYSILYKLIYKNA